MSLFHTRKKYVVAGRVRVASALSIMLILSVFLSTGCLEEEHYAQQNGALKSAELADYRYQSEFDNHTDGDDFDGNTDQLFDDEPVTEVVDQDTSEVINCDFGAADTDWPEQLLKQGRLGICWKIAILNANFYAVPGFSPAANLAKMDKCLKKKGIKPNKGLKVGKERDLLDCKVKVVGATGKKIRFTEIPWSVMSGPLGGIWCQWLSKALSTTSTGGQTGQAVAFLRRPSGTRHVIHIRTWECGPPFTFTGTDPNGVVISGKVNAAGVISGCNRARLNGYSILNIAVETPPSF